MLIAGIVDAIVQKGYQILLGIFLRIDAIVYNLVSGFYNIFLFLAKINLFNYEDYSNIVKRIYIVLGVVMLFILTYSLLRAVINPDDFAKGENSFPNIIKNVIVSLVIITLLPTVFDVVFRVQAVILNSDVIGKLILSDNFTTGVIASGGRTMSTNVFKAFIRLDESARTSEDYAAMADGIENALNEAFLAVEQGQSFMIFTNEFVDSYGESYYFPELAADNAIDYTFIVSTAAGIFLLWTIVLFCFDLGIRAIKLIYYQLIAPVAVVCRVMPGKKMKSVFDNWVKYTISTFLEVFIRIFVMYLGVYLINLVTIRMGSIFTAASNSGLNVAQRFLVVAFLIMGIVAFIRQAPKLLQEVFGFESGSLNLGFRKAMAERLGAGGALAAAGFIGGTVGGFGQRLREAKDAGRGWKSAFSAIAGGIGGGRRAFMKNLGSKSMDDFRKNTTEGINDMLAKGRKNDQERAQFGSKFRAKKNAVKEFLGVNPDVAALDRQINSVKATVSSIDDMENFAKEILTKAKTTASFVKAPDKYKGVSDTVVKEFNKLFDGYSLATIEQEITRMKTDAGTRDYAKIASEEIAAGKGKYIDAYRQSKIEELKKAGHNAQTIDAYLKSGVFKNDFQKFMTDGRASTADSERLSQMESIYNQLEKSSIEYVANQVSMGNDFSGVVNEQQMATMKALLESATATVNNSQVAYKNKIDANNPDPYSQLDSIRKEAKTSSYELSSQKQKIIQNQSKGS